MSRVLTGDRVEGAADNSDAHGAASENTDCWVVEGHDFKCGRVGGGGERERMQGEWWRWMDGWINEKGNDSERDRGEGAERGKDCTVWVHTVFSVLLLLLSSFLSFPSPPFPFPSHPFLITRFLPSLYSFCPFGCPCSLCSQEPFSSFLIPSPQPGYCSPPVFLRFNSRGLDSFEFSQGQPPSLPQVQQCPTTSKSSIAVTNGIHPCCPALLPCQAMQQRSKR